MVCQFNLMFELFLTELLMLEIMVHGSSKENDNKIHTQTCANCMQGLHCGSQWIPTTVSCTCPVDNNQCIDGGILGVEARNTGTCTFYKCDTMRENPEYTSSRLAETSDCPTFSIATLYGFKSNCAINQSISAISSEENCLNLCLDTSGCRGITYMRVSGDCSLHDCDKFTDGSEEILYSSDGTLDFTSAETLHASEIGNLTFTNWLSSSLEFENEFETKFVGLGFITLSFSGTILFKTGGLPMNVYKAVFSFGTLSLYLNYSNDTKYTVINVDVNWMELSIQCTDQEEMTFTTEYASIFSTSVSITIDQRIYLSDIAKKNAIITKTQTMTVSFKMGLRFSMDKTLSISNEMVFTDSGSLSMVEQLSDADVVFIKRNCKTELPISTTSASHTCNITMLNTATTKSDASTLTTIKTTLLTEEGEHTPDSATAHPEQTTKFVPKPIYIIPCPCGSREFENKTTEEIINELLVNITIDVKKTGNRKRRYFSAPDRRPSSTAIGYVGVLSLVVVFGIVTVPDVCLLIKYLFCKRES